MALLIDVDDGPRSEEIPPQAASVPTEGTKESFFARRVQSEYFSELDTKLTKSKAGPFILGRVLGKGVTGTVYEGTHMLTGFKVALKVIKKKSFLKTSHRWKSLRREIAIMKLMDHPNVLKLYDVFETQDKIFLVIELIKGGDLFTHVAQGPLRTEECLRLLAQVIMGIQHCHEHCIVHRDLKLENLLLDEDKNAKIADFGMARMAKAGRTLSTICGSPHYASPEVLKGGKYDGKVSDVWSLGVILFAMATAGLPFDDESMPKLFRRIYRGEFSIPNTVDPNIADLIRKMIVVDCKERIKMEEIQYHRAFQQTEYFMRTLSLDSQDHRIREITHLDEVVFEDLLAILGSSDAHKEEVRSRVMSTNIQGTPEKVLYLLLSKRKQHRIQQLTQLSPRPSPKRPSAFFGSPSSASPAVPSSPSFNSDMEPRGSPPTLERIPSQDPPPLSISSLDIGKEEPFNSTGEKSSQMPALMSIGPTGQTKPFPGEGTRVAAFYNVSGQSERVLPASFSPSNFSQKKSGFFAPPLPPQIPTTPLVEVLSPSAETMASISTSAPTTRRQSAESNETSTTSSSSSSTSTSTLTSIPTTPSPPIHSIPLPLNSTPSPPTPSTPNHQNLPPSVSPIPQLPSTSLLPITPSVLHSSPTSPKPLIPPPHTIPILPSASLSPPPPSQLISSSSSPSITSVSTSASISSERNISPENMITPPTSPFRHHHSHHNSSAISPPKGSTSPSHYNHHSIPPNTVSRPKGATSPSPTYMHRVNLSPHGRHHSQYHYPQDSGRLSPLPSFPEEGRLSPQPEIRPGVPSGARRKGSAPLMINPSLQIQTMKTGGSGFGHVRKGSFPRNTDQGTAGNEATTPEVTKDDEVMTPGSAPTSRRASSGTLRPPGVSSSGGPGSRIPRKTFSKHVDTAFRDDTGSFVGRAYTVDSKQSTSYVSYSVPSSPTAPHSPDVPTSPTVTQGQERPQHWFKDIFTRRPSLDPWRTPMSASYHTHVSSSAEEDLSSPYIPRTHTHPMPQDPPLYPRASSTNSNLRQSRSPTRISSRSPTRVPSRSPTRAARKKFTEQRHRMMRYFRMTSPAALQTHAHGPPPSSSSGTSGMYQPPPTTTTTSGGPPASGMSRALSPTRFRTTSPRGELIGAPTLVPNIVSKSILTTSPPRSGVSSPMQKIRSSGNIRNLQSPDHKLTNG